LNGFTLKSRLGRMNTCRQLKVVIAPDGAKCE
jgi:hypothetical protein